MVLSAHGKSTHRYRYYKALRVSGSNYKIKEKPYTKITFDDETVLNLKTQNLDYDYMAYIIVRELAERNMAALEMEEAKV